MGLRQSDLKHCIESTIEIDSYKSKMGEDKDIVVGSLQSLSMKEYDEEIFEKFGFAVFDEAHHLSAEVFSKAMRKISPKYILGLSATIKRNDNTFYSC